MRTRRAGSTATFVGAIVLTAACGRLPGVQQDVHREPLPPTVARVFQSHALPVFVAHDKRGAHLWNLTRQFYESREYRPAWFQGNSPTRRATELADALKQADRDGLDPGFYGPPSLAARTDDWMRADVWLTYEYLHYASDLAGGLVEWTHADPNWKLRPTAFDLVASLKEAVESGAVSPSLDALRPRAAQYRALCDALVKYRAIAATGGWPELPANLRLKPGQPNAAVPTLARRLAITGDYAGPISEDDAAYRADLQDAVKRFQQRHGLPVNGVVSDAVVAEMNVPADARVRQIELNLERWRWLPRDLGDRHIFVNIPEYRLEVWDHGSVPLAMRVIVGRKDTPTPVFSEAMTHVVFAPYWNVPPDIVEKETLPSMLKNPDFLRRTNMDVLDRHGKPIDPDTIDLDNPSAYRFRQRPGGSNSLGLVKFLLPNHFNVYLHDTPAESLFARAARSLSHGCVRLQEPEKLAEYVLSDQPSWTPERIQQAMHAGEQTSVKLRAPIPVYLGYFTARVDSDGVLQFRKDIYGIDGQHGAMLAAGLRRDALVAAAMRNAGGAFLSADRGSSTPDLRAGKAWE